LFGILVDKQLHIEELIRILCTEQINVSESRFGVALPLMKFLLNGSCWDNEERLTDDSECLHARLSMLPVDGAMRSSECPSRPL